MKERVYNFSPGPAVLPVPVLETVRDNLLNYQESGLGIMEMSHRGKLFEDILATADSNLRELLGISADYDILWTTGGATMQFSMVPMNLLTKGKTADYIITGEWASKAQAEAKKFGETHVAASTEDRKFSYIPSEFSFLEDPAYVHFTSNNTIHGTQFASEPAVGKRELVCDASSDFLHKQVNVEKYGLIYAGAQKNAGPAGITIVVIRKNLLQRSPQGLPILLDYNTYAKNSSLYNTIPSFNVYVVGEVFKWIKREGGLAEMERRNKEKAGLLYSALDASQFYRPNIEKNSRSLMNVTFRLPSEELEGKFVKEAESAGLNGLKGHRVAGGIRASIYNAFPKAGVEALVAFMKDFESKNG